MKIYCVYKHTTPSGKVYIGITCRNPKVRWGYGSGYRDQAFGRAIKKYGWNNITHEILFEGLDELSASRKEQELIKKYNSTDPRHGYNINSGGTYGNQISEAGRQRLASYKKVPVNQFTKDGELIARYESVKEAAEANNINRAHISEACLGHRQLKTVGGYVWKFEGDPFVPLKYEHWGKTWRKVAQYTKDGVFIREFESIGAAKRETGARHIRRVLNGENETSGGYVWKEVT